MEKMWTAKVCRKLATMVAHEKSVRGQEIPTTTESKSAFLMERKVATAQPRIRTVDEQPEIQKSYS